MYRSPHAAPLSTVAESRRGRTAGRFCRDCQSVYPLHASRHGGKPTDGRDHVASPCVHEGRPFTDSAPWWEPAVEILPEPQPKPEPLAAAS